jgi:hypothetical protein
METLFNAVRNVVSGDKRRYVDDTLNINLDLAYVTDRIIGNIFTPPTFQQCHFLQMEWKLATEIASMVNFGSFSLIKRRCARYEEEAQKSFSHLQPF